jgi:hypothetical protein
MIPAPADVVDALSVQRMLASPINTEHLLHAPISLGGELLEDVFPRWMRFENQLPRQV